MKILFKEYLVPSTTLLSEERIFGSDINDTRDPFDAFEEFDMFQNLDGSGSESDSDKDEIVVDLQPYLEKLKGIMEHYACAIDLLEHSAWYL
ncbi:hypothetical protein P3S68_014750 [Capsicum galapagoense]